MDPGDVHLLGYSFEEKYYFDLALPMRLRSAAHFCQMVTTAVCHVFSEKGFSTVLYIDDLGGGEIPEKVDAAFTTLGKLLNDIELQEAPEKAWVLILTQLK